MTDGPDNLVLALLRKMDAKLDRIVDDVHDLKVRTTNLEEQMAGLYRAISGTNRRLDRIEDRVDRVERRLNIRDIELMEAGEKFEGGDD